MNLKYSYWYFQSVLSPILCNQIVNYGNSLREEVGITKGYDNKKLEKNDLNTLYLKRNSNISWIDDKWIYKYIHPYVQQANENAGWNFQWDFTEQCQFTKYNKEQHYGWHCDSDSTPYDVTSGIDKKGKIRKLSVTISLSDPKDYDGGNLEFDFRNDVDWENNKEKGIKECFEIRPKGSIIVFPSFVWHRVKPVTRGTRYSLVCWNLGWPYK
jgi:PKHD-type hydroxylase